MGREPLVTSSINLIYISKILSWFVMGIDVIDLEVAQTCFAFVPSSHLGGLPTAPSSSCYQESKEDYVGRAG